MTGYVIATYALASLAYGIAGILIAGSFPTPGLQAGSTYLLPTIAAVVLGGTSPAGGTGSVVATALGAVLLTQPGQVRITQLSNVAAIHRCHLPRAGGGETHGGTERRWLRSHHRSNTSGLRRQR